MPAIAIPINEGYEIYQIISNRLLRLFGVVFLVLAIGSVHADTIKRDRCDKDYLMNGNGSYYTDDFGTRLSTNDCGDFDGNTFNPRDFDTGPIN
jgi:hypothetical protein